MKIYGAINLMMFICYHKYQYILFVPVSLNQKLIDSSKYLTCAYLGRQKTILVWFLFYIYSSFKRKVHSLHLCVAQAHPQSQRGGSRRHGGVTVASGMTGSGAKGRSEGPGTESDD